MSPPDFSKLVHPIGSVHPDPCPSCGQYSLILVWIEKGGYIGYACRNEWNTFCDGFASAHQETGEPMGRAGNKKIKRLRIEAHRQFDFLWEKKFWISSRKNAYRALAEWLGQREVHISHMTTEEELAKVIEFSRLVKRGEIDVSKLLEKRKERV